MGNLSSLPALAINPPAAPPNPLAEFSQVAAIQSHLQQQQAQQQEMQIRGQQIKDQQATTAAFQNWDPNSGDYDSLSKAVLANGGSANAADAVQQHFLTVQQAKSALSEKQIADFNNKRKASADSLGP